MKDDPILMARLELAEAMAWLDRVRSSGRTFHPGDTKGWFNNGLLCGYAHDDSVEVVMEGPVRVERVNVDRDAWIRSNTARDGSRYGALVDTYYDVEPIGWTPRCPKTGEPLTSCWVFGPTYRITDCDG